MSTVRTPTPPTSTVRLAYVGPNMDLAERAYRPVHTRLGHDTQYVRTVSEVASLPLVPDVVVINPLVITTQGIDGACALQAVIPRSTLMVALYTSLGSSHAMYTRHALGGHCHPRMLLHYPNPVLRPEDIVSRVDALARRRGGGAQVSTTGHLPSTLTVGCARTGLGELLAEESRSKRSAEGSLTFARLLYVAASDSSWKTWKDLANLLDFAEGHVKNTKARLGQRLRSTVLPDQPEAGSPTHGTWRIAEFTRFVTEHRSFIRAYCEHHLAGAC